MMDLKGMLNADCVTRCIPNLLRSGGGEDTSWLPELYRVMERDTTSLDVDLMHANLSFVLEGLPTYEPRGAFVEIPEELLGQVPGVLPEPYLILERRVLQPGSLELMTSRGEVHAPDVFVEQGLGRLAVVSMRPARLLRVRTEQDMSELKGLLRGGGERKSVWSLSQ